MAEPKTDLNESLCCIALSYIHNYSKDGKGVADFIDMIIDDSGKTPEEFSVCVSNKFIEIGTETLKRHSTYRTAYGRDKSGEIKYKAWIEGSYYSAKAIIDKLNVNLNDYIISRPDKTQVNNKAYVIKERCTSAIKNWAQVYGSTAVAKANSWTPGILSNLNSDKINIADIMLVHKQSKIYDEIDEMQKITNDIKWKDVENNPSVLKQLLTPKKYVEYMNEAWRKKEIFNISLKQVKSQDFPVKLINLNISNANEYHNDIDEFQFLLMSLIGAAKSGSLSNFENFIKKTIDLQPVVFTANDRLEVKYKLNIKNLKLNNIKSYDYTMWTNFGGGTNSVYFSPSKSGSASGEGGITLSYFQNLVQDIPELRTFLTYMKLKRIEYFNKACEKYNITFDHSKMGTEALTSSQYNSMLYTSSNFKRLVHVLLTDTEAKTKKDIITPVEWNKNLENAIIIDDFKGTIGKDENKRNVIEKYVVYNQEMALQRLNCLEYFFETYVDFLSNQNNTMGGYFGISESTKQDIVRRSKKIANDYRKKFNALVLQRRVEKIIKSQEKITDKTKRDPRMITKQGAVSETKIKQLMKTDKQFALEASKKIKLISRELSKFTSESKKYAQLENKQHIEPSFKKSFALLANAEFGYMYSEYADRINELVKKKVLLSLYAAASGRGYIIFDGKKFEADDYYKKDIKGAPYLKIGM